MSLKQKKYFDTNCIYKIFNNNVNNFFLITHVNNLNNVEFVRIKTYCIQNNIENTFIKLNLLKKLTKNNLFISLMTGPTKIFFFSNLNSLFEFANISFVKKKIIPLAIYWNNNFYNYNFFENYVKLNFALENSLKLDLKVNQIKLLFSLKESNITFINLFNNNINKLIFILNNVNKKKI